ncbi:DUF298-domain-containing protein [Cristinia sonorae]|uniref:Defective in cullin neddylation protein n=1 Tax=Cristinia sonorae TaxID=1940300 RepID=A0A8K0XRU7_9AGAR|nr:DUF298-domain-containing protein [Cristinia sonorae]
MKLTFLLCCIASTTAEPETLDSDTTSTATKNSKPAAKVQRSADPSKPEPYSPSRAADLYSTYADDDDQGVIGPEELEKLFGDAGISLEGSLPLLLAWLFGSTEMAKVTKAEWEKGTAGLRISSLPALSAALTDLENLLVHDKPPLKPAQTTPSSKKNTSSSDPYDRSQYFRLAHDPKKAFLEFYLFVYTLSKPPQSRNIEIETACALWSVILAPRYPMVDDIISFINEKGTYKAVTKDLWSMMLEFCQTVSPNLDDYDPEAAWPTLLDDYVSTKKSKVDGAPSNANAI